MKVRLLVALLAVVLALTAVPVKAQYIIPNAEPVPTGLVYDLGSIPRGKIIDLPSWACGNIVVKKFDFSEDLLILGINIPKDFFPSEAAYLKNSNSGTVGLKPGTIHTVNLVDGTAFSLYWKYSDDVPKHVLLVLRRHCFTDGCRKLCDCEP